MLIGGVSSRFDDEKPEEGRDGGARLQIYVISREDFQSSSITPYIRQLWKPIHYFRASQPMTPKLLLSVAFGFGLFLALSGCNSNDSDQPEATPPEMGTDSNLGEESSHDHSEHEHAGHGQGSRDHAGKTDMEKMAAALADFSEEDRRSAMAQHFCPVSGEMLGTMGKPEKVEVEGQQVWICCDGCKDKLLAEPDKYIAKLSN